MDTFEDLSSDDGLKRKSGIKEHDFNLNTTATHLIFDPRHKLAVQLLQEKYLDVRNICRISSWDLKLCILICLASTGAQTSLSISTIVSITVGRSASLSVATVIGIFTT